MVWWMGRVWELWTWLWGEGDMVHCCGVGRDGWCWWGGSGFAMGMGGMVCGVRMGGRCGLVGAVCDGWVWVVGPGGGLCEVVAVVWRLWGV